MTTNSKNLESTLLKLNQFCIRHKIDYVLTGTLALKILGFPSESEPHDIDIIVSDLTEENKKLLLDLWTLSGITRKIYQDTGCYSFMIDYITINALVSNKDKTKEEIRYIPVALDQDGCSDIIKVQLVEDAFKAKMELHRPKDYEYALKAISKLAEYTK